MKKATFQLAVSSLMIFGIIAISAGIFTLAPSTEIIILLGLILIGIGVSLKQVKGMYSWTLVSFITLVLGALLAAGGLTYTVENMQIGFLIAALVFIIVAVLARSGFMSALSAIAIGNVMGLSAGYGFFGSGSYSLGFESRTFAIVGFTLLALIAYNWAQNLKAPQARLATIFARMSLVLINIAFWFGSLFGDMIGEIDYFSYEDFSVFDSLYEKQSAFLPSWFDGVLIMPADFFAIGWAIALVLAGAWAVKANNRFTLNTVTVFAAIHFYTQWFEYFGAEAWSLLIAGCLAVLTGVGLSLMGEGKPKKRTVKKAAASTPAKTVAKKATPKKKTAAKKAPAKKKATPKKKTVAKKAPAKKTTKKKATAKKTTKKK